MTSTHLLSEISHDSLEPSVSLGVAESLNTAVALVTGFLALLVYVSRAHEIAICASYFVHPSVSQ